VANVINLMDALKASIDQSRRPTRPLARPKKSSGRQKPRPRQKAAPCQIFGQEKKPAPSDGTGGPHRSPSTAGFASGSREDLVRQIEALGGTGCFVILHLAPTSSSWGNRG